MKELLQLLDKHMDQEGFLKDAGMTYAKPYLEGIKAKVISGELDLVSGTEMDDVIILKVIDLILERAKI